MYLNNLIQNIFIYLEWKYEQIFFSAYRYTNEKRFREQHSGMFFQLSFTRMEVCISLIIILACCLRNGYATEPTIVHINYGDVLGYQTELARAFHDIPFAQLPVNRIGNCDVEYLPISLDGTHQCCRVLGCPQPACSMPSNLCPITVNTLLMWEGFSIFMICYTVLRRLFAFKYLYSAIQSIIMHQLRSTIRSI